MNCWRAFATYQVTLIPIAFLRTLSAPVQDTAFPSAWLPELLQYAEPPVKAAAGPKSPEPRYTLDALALSNAANCSAAAWGAATNARNAIHRVRAIARVPKVAHPQPQPRDPLALEGVEALHVAVAAEDVGEMHARVELAQVGRAAVDGAGARPAHARPRVRARPEDMDLSGRELRDTA